LPKIKHFATPNFFAPSNFWAGYATGRPCVLSNISIVAISVGLPVTVNNPVPASQVRFQQFRAINASKAATNAVIVGTPGTI